MAGFFSRKKKEDAVNGRSSKAKKGTVPAPLQPSKPKWEDAWARKSVDPEEVQELLRGCTLELKSKGMVSLLCYNLSHGRITYITIS